MLRRSAVVWLLLCGACWAAPPTGFQTASGTFAVGGDAVSVAWGDEGAVGGENGFVLSHSLDGVIGGYVYDADEDGWEYWETDGFEWTSSGTYHENPFSHAYGQHSGTSWESGSVPSAWGMDGLETFGGELSLPDTGVDMSGIVDLLASFMGSVVVGLVLAFAAFVVVKIALRWFGLVRG